MGTQKIYEMYLIMAPHFVQKFVLKAMFMETNDIICILVQEDDF